MARVSKAAMKPGTERYRDERRNDSKPKMHGKQWHDHDPNVVEGEQGSHLGGTMAARGPVRDSGATEGMGKHKAGTRGAQRKRMTPVSKGRKGERAKTGTQAPRAGMRTNTAGRSVVGKSTGRAKPGVGAGRNVAAGGKMKSRGKRI